MSPVFVKFAGVAAYLVFVTGLGSLCVGLLSHVGMQAEALVAPYLAGSGARSITLVERRRLESVLIVATVDPPAVKLTAVGAASGPHAPLFAEADKRQRVELGAVHADLDALDAVALGNVDIVSAVDLVAQADFALAAIELRPVGRSRARQPAQPVRVAAADVFGRGFGVMLTAAR